jgi:hypothetical protein
MNGRWRVLHGTVAGARSLRSTVPPSIQWRQRPLSKIITNCTSFRTRHTEGPHCAFVLCLRHGRMMVRAHELFDDSHAAVTLYALTAGFKLSHYRSKKHHLFLHPGEILYQDAAVPKFVYPLVREGSTSTIVLLNIKITIFSYLSFELRTSQFEYTVLSQLPGSLRYCTAHGTVPIGTVPSSQALLDRSVAPPHVDEIHFNNWRSVS